MPLELGLMLKLRCTPPPWPCASCPWQGARKASSEQQTQLEARVSAKVQAAIDRAKASVAKEGGALPIAQEGSAPPSVKDEV